MLKNSINVEEIKAGFVLDDVLNGAVTEIESDKIERIINLIEDEEIKKALNNQI